jgi:hypothetical protein
VACYIITDTGNILLQQFSPSLLSPVTRIQTFGGCDYPNHLARMMNSLRLELMDECGLVLREKNMIRCSPLIVLPDGKQQTTLLQVLLVRDEAVSECWSAETARRVLGEQRVPPEAGGSENVDEEVRKRGRSVHKVPLSEARSLGKWRECDLNSFGLLEKIISELREGEMKADELVLLDSPGTPEEEWKQLVKLKNIFEMPVMAEFRRVARVPWYPILWNDASRVFQVSAGEFMKLK